MKPQLFEVVPPAPLYLPQTGPASSWPFFPASNLFKSGNAQRRDEACLAIQIARDAAGSVGWCQRAKRHLSPCPKTELADLPRAGRDLVRCGRSVNSLQLRR